MKKLLVSVVALLAVLSSFSQNTDSTKTQNKPIKKVYKYAKDRLVIGFSFNNWTPMNNTNFQSKWYSRGFCIGYMYDLRFKKSLVSFAPGIMFSSSNIYHRSDIHLDSTGFSFVPLVSHTLAQVKVDKISLNYLDIPLEIRFRTKPDKLDNMWKFALGVKVGILVDSHNKFKYSDSTGTHVDVHRRYSDVNRFRFGPTLRVGYSSFNLVGYYGVLGVFKNNRGPKENEWSVGILFNGL